MGAFQTDILAGAAPALEGAAALFLALALTQPKAAARWRRSLPLLAAAGLACGLCARFWDFRFFLPALAALSAAAVKVLFSSSWIYAGITGLSAGILVGVQRLAITLPVPGCVPLVSTLALSCLCWWRGAVLLPEAENIPIGADKKHSRRFVRTLAAVAAALCEMLLWICCLLSSSLRLPRSGRLRALLFTLAALLTLLLFARRLTHSAVERIEALIDKQYQAELLNFMQIIRSQRHDFNFHLQAISGMLEGGRCRECQEYVQQMAKSTSVMNEVLPLRNPATSAMLNSFREIALQKQIRFDISIRNDLSRFPCSVYETNTIIGNLIQNAIDEVEKHPSRRYIDLLILKRGGDIILKVTNPCSRTPDEFKDIFRPGYSTKPSHEGIGLTTVSRLAARYGGSVHLEFASGAVSFIVRIAAVKAPLGPDPARRGAADLS